MIVRGFVVVFLFLLADADWFNNWLCNQTLNL